MQTVLNLDEKSIKYIDNQIKNTNKTKDMIINDLILERADYEAWCDAQVQIALGELDRGELLSHDEVVANMRKLGYNVS